MILSIKEIKKLYQKKIKGVIHIWAHNGEEIQRYIYSGIKNILLIEANIEKIKILEKKKKWINFFLNNKINIENYAITNFKGESKFYITNNSESSSLLKLKEHRSLYPDIRVRDIVTVNCITLDELIFSNYEPTDYNFINIDIQGNELNAFKGAEKLLKNIDVVYSEINLKELYEGGGLVEELDDYLNKFGFERKMTSEIHGNSWGDAFYIKNK